MRKFALILVLAYPSCKTVEKKSESAKLFQASQSCRVTATLPLNLRAGPSTSDAILVKMQANDSLEAVAGAVPKGGFMHVKHAATGQTGWASQEYISCSPGTGTSKFADFVLTGSFDGSRSFKMWTEALQAAREIEKNSRKAVHFTFFINGVYFDETLPAACGIGKAESREEVVTRWAVAQQAINEGHEIGNHSLHHGDPSKEACQLVDPSVDFWAKDFAAMESLVARNLFDPVYEDGKAVFPAWEPRNPAGEVGGLCVNGSQCAAPGFCQEVTGSVGFCTVRCNRSRPCPGNTLCGGAGWQNQEDLCLPRPRFPIALKSGEVLFDAAGRPSPQAVSKGTLKPYKMIGMRAPFLSQAPSMYQVMDSQSYLYDATSPTLALRAPYVTTAGLMEFPLMRADPTWPMPFDTEYERLQVNGATMLEHYKAAIRQAMQKQVPWNIASHFSFWAKGPDGVLFWDKFRETFRWAAEGCDGSCPKAFFPSFKELYHLIQ